MHRAPVEKFVQTVVAATVLLASCQQQSPSSSQSVVRQPDFAPKYLPAEKRQLGLVKLTRTGAVLLKQADGTPVKRFGRISVAPHAIYLTEPSRHRVDMFDRQGRFVRSIGENGKKNLIAPHAAFFSSRRRLLLVADAASGIVAFDTSGNSADVLQLDGIQHPSSVFETKGGSLLVVRQAAGKPSIYLFRRGRFLNSFYSRRWSDQNYRGSMHHLHITADSSENLYVASGVDYEIRKFDKNGEYSGDFNTQKNDPLYSHPPESLDEETRLRLRIDPDFSAQWGRSWSQVRCIEVLMNKLIVVCLAVHRSKEYLLHFYTLDGNPIAQSLPFDHVMVGADNEEGVLYFSQQGTEGIFLLTFAAEVELDV